VGESAENSPEVRSMRNALAAKVDGIAPPQSSRSGIRIRALHVPSRNRTAAEKRGHGNVSTRIPSRVPAGESTRAEKRAPRGFT